MKRLFALLILFVFALPLLAQTSPATPVTVNPPLPTQVFGVLLFDNGGKLNGSAFAALPFPGASNPGTYMYNAVDFLRAGHGQIMTVPTVGLAQHVVWFTPKIELFGLLSGGIAVAPSNPVPGTTVTGAFGGGAGVNIGVKNNFYVPVLFKVVQAQGINTLAFGVGISWGR